MFAHCSVQFRLELLLLFSCPCGGVYMRSEEKGDGADEMLTEEITDDLRIQDTADAMRTA